MDVPAHLVLMVYTAVVVVTLVSVALQHPFRCA
jgi:hypothetical protein